MHTLHEEIHTGRTWHTQSYKTPVDAVKFTSAEMVSQIQDKKPQASLEEELWGYYVAENSSRSRKQIIGFLRNPDKIRKVAEFTLREVRNGYNGQANVGDKTVREISNLINEELTRRSNQASVLIKR